MKAFPHDTAVLNSSERGMDLRDYFAAQAINGMIAHGDCYNVNAMSEYAYELADAMMEARK